MASVLKTEGSERAPGVRIPHPPQVLEEWQSMVDCARFECGKFHKSGLRGSNPLSSANSEQNTIKR